MQSSNSNPESQDSVQLSPVNPFKGSFHIENGRPSIIHEHCLKAFRGGHKKCIWICMKKRNRWIAKDICLEKKGLVLGIPELRMKCSWWKQHSLYSVVGVKEVMVRSNILQIRTSYHTEQSS